MNVVILYPPTLFYSLMVNLSTTRCEKKKVLLKTFCKKINYWNSDVRVLRNSANTEFRTFFDFRTFRMLYEITENSAELYGIPCQGMRENSAEFLSTEFCMSLRIRNLQNNF
jgi:hypothetical protein